MTERQEKFCLEYIRHGNAAVAYRAAGYNPQSKGSAEAMGSRLLRNVNVRQRLAELRKKMEGPAIMDAQERREKLTEIARSPATEDKDIIKAIDTLNKMDSLYIQKTELSGKVQTVPDRLVIDYGGDDDKED